MKDGIAPLHGSAIYYCYTTGDRVLISRQDYNTRNIDKETFLHLYYELDGYAAALKEDCIQYAMYIPYKPLSSYPDWFVEAYNSGKIYEEEGYDNYIFYSEYGDIVMSPGGIVLMNFKGELNYMEPEDFIKYYDTEIGG